MTSPGAYARIATCRQAQKMYPVIGLKRLIALVKDGTVEGGRMPKEVNKKGVWWVDVKDLDRFIRESSVNRKRDEIRKKVAKRLELVQ